MDGCSEASCLFVMAQVGWHDGRPVTASLCLVHSVVRYGLVSSAGLGGGDAVRLTQGALAAMQGVIDAVASSGISFLPLIPVDMEEP